ncbi:MAG TPA: alpha/beta hydrolase-fold protein [Pyrinomonadaceae bacterium]|nr:alpha/beta hydrolase-fold protein [Pyrinomonadaceae bacterium]
MRSLLFSLILLGGISVTGSSVMAQEQRSGLLARTVKVGVASYDYQVYVPAKLRGQAKPPVILFLHGISQRGEGGFVPAEGSANALMRNYLEQIPAIVLLPHCRRGRFWHDAEMERMVTESLRQTVAEFGADEARLYLTGVSMGGFGAWHIAAKHPGRFAALVPICGGSTLVAADRFTPVARGVGKTPVWVFHGADDPIVPVSESRGMVAALKAAGGDVRYNEYAGVGHNVWFNVLAERELLPWMLAQRLRP